MTNPEHPSQLPGIGLMVLAAIFFSLMTALIPLAGKELHPFQIAFFRNLFGLLAFAPVLLKTGTQVLQPKRLGWLSLRALLGAATMLTWFYVLTVMPIAEATALSFTAPLFVTIGAAFVLKETVRMRRWTATLIGFIGVLIILQPGTQAISMNALIAIASALAMAGSILIIKHLSTDVSSETIVVYMVIMMTPLTLIPALFVWQWPSATIWLWLVLLGVCGTAGHLFFTNSLRISDASAVMPFDYSRLLVIAALGYWLFGQTLPWTTWFGALIIAVSGIYIAHRESRASRQKNNIVMRPPTAPP